MPNNMLILVLCMLLSACASAVGWGKSWEVLHKNKQSISFKYDSLLADIKDFAPTADEHCAEHSKDAIPEGIKDTQINVFFGGVHTFTFKCQ